MRELIGNTSADTKKYENFINAISREFKTDEDVIIMPTGSRTNNLDSSHKITKLSSDYDLLIIIDSKSMSRTIDTQKQRDFFSNLERVISEYRDSFIFTPTVHLKEMLEQINKDKHLHGTDDEAKLPVIHLIIYPTAGCLKEWEDNGFILSVLDNSARVDHSGNAKTLRHLATLNFSESDGLDSLISLSHDTYSFLKISQADKEIKVDISAKILPYCILHTASRLFTPLSHVLKKSSFFDFQLTHENKEVFISRYFERLGKDRWRKCWDQSIKFAKSQHKQDYSLDDIKLMFEDYFAASREEIDNIGIDNVASTYRNVVDSMYRDASDKKTLKYPYFEFVPGVIKSNAEKIKKLFKESGLTANIFYASKANQLKYVIDECYCSKDAISGYEVMNYQEYQELMRFGVKSNDIIYTASSYSKSDLINFKVNQPKIFVVDSLEQVEQLSDHIPGNVPILIRIDPSFYGCESQKYSKFGATREMTINIARFCAAKDNLEFQGIHFHGDYIRNSRSFRCAFLAAIEVLKNLKKIVGANSSKTIIDIGGAFTIRDDANLVFITEIISEQIDFIKQHNVDLFLEPGRALVENAFRCYTKVQAIKKKGDKSLIFTDIGINNLPKLDTQNYLFRGKKTKAASKFSSSIRICGPTGMWHDYFDVGYTIGDLMVGDIVTVENAGAYTISLWSKFGGVNPQIHVPDKILSK